MSPPPTWQTRANALTALRLLAAPVLVVALRSGEAELALGLLLFAVATDFADGWVARRYGETSPLGGLVDHAVDAAFVTCAAAALALGGVLPAVLPALVAAAFLQYALDSRVGQGRPLRASTLGRWNGMAYYVAVALPIARDAFGLAWPAPAAVLAFGWLLVASTLVSMLDRWLASRRAPQPR